MQEIWHLNCVKVFLFVWFLFIYSISLKVKSVRTCGGLTLLSWDQFLKRRKPEMDRTWVPLWDISMVGKSPLCQAGLDKKFLMLDHQNQSSLAERGKYRIFVNCVYDILLYDCSLMQMHVCECLLAPTKTLFITIDPPPPPIHRTFFDFEMRLR